MTTTKQLTTKITELTTKVTELEARSHIDPLKASAEEITKNAQDEQLARENATHLKSVIEQLQAQLIEQQAEEEAAKLLAESKKSFTGLLEQGDRVTEAANNFYAELAKLRELGSAIASKHKKATGKLALDDRVGRNFIMPKVEQLGQSLMIHTEVRNYKK